MPTVEKQEIEAEKAKTVNLIQDLLNFEIPIPDGISNLANTIETLIQVTKDITEGKGGRASTLSSMLDKKGVSIVQRVLTWVARNKGSTLTL